MPHQATPTIRFRLLNRASFSAGISRLWQCSVNIKEENRATFLRGMCPCGTDQKKPPSLFGRVAPQAEAKMDACTLCLCPSFSSLGARSTAVNVFAVAVRRCQETMEGTTGLDFDLTHSPSASSLRVSQFIICSRGHPQIRLGLGSPVPILNIDIM